MPKFVAHKLDTGEPVDIGSAVTNFRGEPGTLERVTRANDVGHDGKVIVGGRQYYAGVWGLRVANG